MATSQFTIYSSLDQYGPGYLNGLTGSLITVLDACLVNGYTGKPAAGWSKPFANSGSVIGCYKQGSGSKFTLFINDNGPNVTAVGKEAWATGWETLISSSVPCGTGSGQFPLPSQVLTTGHVVIRKSNTADTILRPWIIYGDASTFHLFIFTGDAPNSVAAYSYFHFGDIYSLAGSSDIWRCLIVGRNTENYSLQLNEDVINAQANTVLTGHYMARTFGGSGQGSINVGKIADVSKSNVGGAYQIGYGGVMAGPNPMDNQFYFSPIWIVENSAYLRGRLRGMYSGCHALGTFADGQYLSGSNDFAGKIFRIVKPGYTNGYFTMETSNTIETND